LQTEPFARLLRETVAVVPDGEYRFAHIAAQSHLHLSRFAVPDRVVNRLLDDSIQMIGGRGVVCRQTAIALKVAPNTRCLRGLLRQPFQTHV